MVILPFFSGLLYPCIVFGDPVLTDLRISAADCVDAVLQILIIPK